MASTLALGENFAPYASANAVIHVIARYRDRGLPEPLTANALEQVGITPSMTSTTYRALRFLGLVDDDGVTTSNFIGIRDASAGEYQGALAEVVRKAYVDVFTITDPAEDNEITIADAFRRYTPHAQRDKMIRLFIGLCEEAGIVERKQRRRTRVTALAQPRVVNAGPQPNAMPDRGGADDLGSPQESDFRLVSAIFQQLPAGGRWTFDRRQRWLGAMTSVVDLLCEIEPLEETAEPTS